MSGAAGDEHELTKADAAVAEFLDPVAARRPAGGLLPGGRARARRSSCARRRSRAPLLLELQRAILERDAWPALRGRAARRDDGLLPPRARPPARRVRRPRLARAKKLDALLGIQAPHDERELAGIDPALIARVARATPAAARGDAEASAGARRCGRRPRARARRGWRSSEFAAFVRRAMFLDQPDPVRAWRGLHGFQDGLIERVARRARAAHRGAGHGPAAVGQGPHVGQLGRHAQHAERRDLHGPARDRAPTATCASRSAPRRRASTSRASSSSSRDGEVVERARRGRRRLPAARARDRRRRAAPRRDRDRHELRDPAADRRDPLRREDRRHRPPRARPLLSRDARQATRARCTGT